MIGKNKMSHQRRIIQFVTTSPHFNIANCDDNPFSASIELLLLVIGARLEESQQMTFIQICVPERRGRNPAESHVLLC